MSSNVNDQDFTPVVLKKNTKSKPKTASGLNKAMREGKVETVKKVDSTNKAHAAPVVNAVKLDNETEDFKHVTVGHEFKMALQKARTEKKMTQADLAKAIAVKQSVIADYESGKAIPDPAIISKIGRALGTKLPKPPKKQKTKDGEGADE